MTKQINGDKLFVIDPHPAIPPADQLKKWEDKWFDEEEHADVLLIQAFQAGADQELEACCEWLRTESKTALWQTKALRAARRPKPPSLKEQALNGLEKVGGFTLCQLGGVSYAFDEYKTHVDNIRRALEALPE
jgi:hypothetical protein